MPGRMFVWNIGGLTNIKELTECQTTIKLIILNFPQGT